MYRNKYEREGNDSWLIDEIIYDNGLLIHIVDHRCDWAGNRNDIYTLAMTPKEVTEYLKLEGLDVMLNEFKECFDISDDIDIDELEANIKKAIDDRDMEEFARLSEIYKTLDIDN